jgi:hypothetical protein
MIIQPNSKTNPTGYVMKLSANDTYNWANRDGARWPCSDLSGNRCLVVVDSNGLLDFTLNGKDGDCNGDELDAIVADHLPKSLGHLWPVWSN